MIRNYIKTAWRNILSNRVVSLISIAGLAVGIGCFLLLATYLINELRYDRFNTKADRIVRLAYNYKSRTDNVDKSIAVTPTGPAPAFKQQFAQVEDAVRIYNYSDYKPATVQYQDRLFNEKKMLVADEGFFKVFSFKFLAGNPATALSGAEGVVITQSTAKKYFGDDNPMGKILKVNSVRNMQVTGVIEDVPPYSSIKFDMMGTYSMLARSKTREWSSANDYSYLLLKPGTNLASLEKSVNAYTDKVSKSETEGHKVWFTLEPLTQVHLYSKVSGSLEPAGNIKYIYILGFIALVLLLLACINFLNLVTAKSIDRAHEIGVRKVMGAMRGQLFIQFITEAAIVTSLSLVAGVVLAQVNFAWFSAFAGHKLDLTIWNTNWLVAALAGLFVVVTLVAGTYPSLYLSAFKPVTTLKGKSTGAAMGNGVLRKSLVIFQFAVSVFFIIGTIIAGRQLQYIQQMDTGLNRSQVMMLDIGGMELGKMQAFKAQLLQQPNVKSVSASYDSPVNVKGGYSISEAEGQPGKINISTTAIPVERDFASTLGIKLIAGSNFTKSDEQQVLDTNSSKRKYTFILNENAVKALGWTPKQAIGKRIAIGGRAGEIKAVARNFNFASLHQEVGPIALFPEYDYFGKMMIKTAGSDEAVAVADVKRTWASFFPNTPFETHFLDEEYEEMYQNEQRIGGILTVFTVVTIFISCLGLFGLAVFSTKQRTREVGIRKVLGAGVFNIVTLISVDFLRLVFISILIAAPVAWYAMHKWLDDFAYRTSISWWMFALAGGIAIVIAFITVSSQSIRAALANPVNSLKNE